MSDVAVRVLDDAASVARETAALFVSLAAKARAAGRRAFVSALAAGPASCLAWAALAAPEVAARVAWEDVLIFPAEERRGSYTHPDSCYRKIYVALGSKVPLPPGALGRLWSEGDDPALVQGYGDVQLRHLLKCDAEAIPRFDLVVLELGGDGRLSGLRPGSPVLAERQLLIAHDRGDATGGAFFTVTPAIVAAADTLVVLASGAEAAAALPHVVNATAHGDRVSLRALRRSGGATIVLADRAAAAEL